MANAVKSIVISPEALGIKGLALADKVKGAEDSYAKVPLVYRATRIRCNSLLKIPFHLYRDDGKTEAEWKFDYPLRKLLWRTRAAGLLTGAGYVLQRDNGRTVESVEWVNPTTMRVSWDAQSRQRVFDQYIGGEHFGPWTDRNMVYIPEFSLKDDIQPGDCPASVALGSTQLAHYITRMAGRFFEDGAMPITVVSSEAGFGTDTDKVENFFKRAMQGIQNAYRVIALRGKGVQVDRIQFALKELATPELYEQARKGVALAFEIPVTLMDDDANYATAKEHKRGFYDETVVPDADVFSEELNAQLFNPLGLHLEFAPEEMDLYQEEEAERANAFSIYVAAGVDMEVAAAMVGLDVPEEQKPIWDAQLLLKRKATEQALERLNTPPQPDKTPTDGKPAPADANAPANKNLKAANVTGVMIALALPTGAALRLAGIAKDALAETDDLTPPEQMHLTLAYFADVADIGTTRETLSALVRVFASEHGLVNGTIGGKGQFNHQDDQGRSAVYAAFDSPTLPAFQHDLTEILDAAGIGFDKTHGFIPHITLGYVADGTALADIELPDMPITFDNVVLAWGGEWEVFPLAANANANKDIDFVPHMARSGDRLLVMGDLDKWERAAHKRVKNGGDLNFNSDHIPPTLKASVLGALEAAVSAEDVRGVFANARTWAGYP